MYVSQEDVTTSSGIILIFVFVLSVSAHCTCRMLELHHIITIHIFVFVLSGICPVHTVH